MLIFFIFIITLQWFQNRYTMMVNQMISALGEARVDKNEIGEKKKRWIVQIFYLPKNKMSMEGISYPGIQKLVKRGQVILTPIPDEYRKLKRKELMLQSWLWENTLAERILIFGGNVVLCSNSLFELKDFNEFDYIGAPWSAEKGVGGDGGLSLRNRTLMLAVLEDYEKYKNKNLNEKISKKQPVYSINEISVKKEKNPYSGTDLDDMIFVKGIRNLIKLNYPARIAAPSVRTQKNVTFLY